MFVLKLFDDGDGGSRPEFSAIIANAGAGMVVATGDRPGCSSGRKETEIQTRKKRRQLSDGTRNILVFVYHH